MKERRRKYHEEKSTWEITTTTEQHGKTLMGPLYQMPFVVKSNKTEIERG
jgi:hypothetical protein